jgi:hypothetical protein
MANGNEFIQNVIGVSSNGQPSGQSQQLTLVGLTNFEGSTYISTIQSVTSSTTLVSSGMSVPVIVGGVYDVDIYLSVTNGASGGLKLSFSTSTCTATAMSMDSWAYNTTTVAAQGNITALASNLVAYTGSVTTVNITGTFVAATAGNLVLSFAQNASNATATSLNVCSNFWCDRIS